MSGPMPARPVPGVNDLPDAEIERLYGPWERLTPAEVLPLFRGAPFPWWIAGGWAMEAGGGRPREHWDTDVAVLWRDLPAVREWFSDVHLWEVHEGSMRPLLPGDDLSPGREQLWVRRDASSPWLLDLPLTPSDGDDWLYKRQPSIRRSLEEIGHTVDGVSFLKPSIVLLFKAKAHRPKDDADLESLLPQLSGEERQWLVAALHIENRDHPWLTLLRR